MRTIITTITVMVATVTNAAAITNSVDSGGARSTNDNAGYVNDGCIGGIGGDSSGGATTARHGYIGQLTEVASVAVTANPAHVNETSTSLLSCTATMDDDSVTALVGGEIVWSTPVWPLLSITTGGLAITTIVYQDTPTAVNGSYLGVNGIGELRVLDSLSDNYGSYAGDGLDDSWQNDYFGLNNPDAAPLMDPDADGQCNRFEFIAGLSPTDAMSRFLLRIEPVVGQPAQTRLIFGPCLTDRSYDILTSTILEADSWSALTGGSVSDNGTERSVIDPTATGNKKFYRVQVAKP